MAAAVAGALAVGAEATELAVYVIISVTRRAVKAGDLLARATVLIAGEMQAAAVSESENWS